LVSLPVDLKELAQRWPSDCIDFLEYWDSLREGNLIPTFEALSINLSPAMLPKTYILDLVDSGAVVRFLGTGIVERWGADFTGKNLLKFFAEDVREAAFSNYHTMVKHPCGHINNLDMVNSDGQQVQTGVIQLPLRIGKNSNAGIVGYLSLKSRFESNDLIQGAGALHSGCWLDIGGDIPATSPLSVHSNKGALGVDFKLE
jgi:hypothetical protein